MKKFIVCLITSIVILMSFVTSYGMEYLDHVDFEKVDSVENTIWNGNEWKSASWSGKEWITDRYPLCISDDGINFSKLEISDEVRQVLHSGDSHAYVWAGSDYLVYDSLHSYLYYESPKYMYRISEDFKSILNKYEIPNFINFMAFIGDKIYIATENVAPRIAEYVTLGVRHCENEVYYSTDCVEWTRLDYEDDHDENDGIYLFDINNKLLINDYLYLDGNPTQILYESRGGDFFHRKLGEYLCRVDFGDEDSDSDTLIFSKDGVYCAYLVIDKVPWMQNISELGDKILIEDYDDYYACDKEAVYSQLRDKLPDDPVYVKLGCNILGFDQPPVIEDDRTLVPLRFLFEQMGADVTWNEETQTAIVTQNDTAVTVGVNDTEVDINGQTVSMDVPARLVNDKTMVPVRFLSEQLGYDVSWDGENRLITIE